MARVIFVPDDVLIVAHLQAKTNHVLLKIYTALICRFIVLDRRFREYCVHGRAVVVLRSCDERKDV